VSPGAPAALVRSVGGVVVGVGSELLPIAADAADIPYRPFALPPASATPDIAVEVAPGDVAAGGTPVFTCGPWEMLRGDGGAYGLRFGTAAGGRPVLAWCDRETTRVALRVAPASAPLDPVRYPLDQLLLMNHLAFRGGLLLHAAGVVLDGVGLVFPGVSGAGKSTLSGLLAAAAPRGALLSDDRIIVRAQDGRFRMYGTPWPGTAGVARNASAPLAAALFLAKGPCHALTRLAPAQAVRRLVQVVSCPWYDRDRLSPVLETCERLVSMVPCFELRFARDPGVAALVTRVAAQAT
jgi:hypothetical protein